MSSYQVNRAMAERLLENAGPGGKNKRRKARLDTAPADDGDEREEGELRCYILLV